MANIVVNPEVLEGQGKNLIKYAGDLENILKSIDQEIQSIDASWDGLAQSAYVDMYSSMKTSLDQFPDLVNSLGEATVSAAQAFSEVDTTLQGSFNSAIG